MQQPPHASPGPELLLQPLCLPAPERMQTSPKLLLFLYLVLVTGSQHLLGQGRWRGDHKLRVLSRLSPALTEWLTMVCNPDPGDLLPSSGTRHTRGTHILKWVKLMCIK